METELVKTMTTSRNPSERSTGLSNKDYHSSVYYLAHLNVDITYKTNKLLTDYWYVPSYEQYDSLSQQSIVQITSLTHTWRKISEQQRNDANLCILPPFTLEQTSKGLAYAAPITGHRGLDTATTLHLTFMRILSTEGFDLFSPAVKKALWFARRSFQQVTQACHHQTGLKKASASLSLWTYRSPYCEVAADFFYFKRFIVCRVSCTWFADCVCGKWCDTCVHKWLLWKDAAAMKVEWKRKCPPKDHLSIAELQILL